MGILLLGRGWGAWKVVEQRALTREASTEMHPVVSPEGKSLLFVSDRTGSLNLWLMPLEGGPPRPLTQASGNLYCDDPAWSPQGDRILFVSNQGGSLDIWVMNADGSGAHPLTTEPSTEWMPCWSPDGRQILFVSDRTGQDSLWLMNADGSNKRLVLPNAWEPTFSPDGRRIAFYTVRDGQEGIWVVDWPPTKEPRLLVAGGREPAFSPDGRWLACVRGTKAEGGSLWVVEVESGQGIALTDETGQPASPSWGPDGKTIYFDAAPQGQRDLGLLVLERVEPRVEVLFPKPEEVVRGALVVRARLGTPEAPVRTYRLEVGRGARPEHWETIAQGESPSPEEQEFAPWVPKEGGGLFLLRLIVTDAAGDQTTIEFPFYVFGEYGAFYERPTLPTQMVAGRTYTAQVHLRNAGLMTWRTQGPYRVEGSYRWRRASGEVVEPTGLVSPLPQDVASGEEVNLEVQVRAPEEPGDYLLEWELRQGGQMWFSDQGVPPLRLQVAVRPGHAVEYRVYNLPEQMVPGQIYTVDVALRNAGVVAWRGEQPAGMPSTGEEGTTQPVALSYRWEDANGREVEMVPLRTPLPHDVASGQTVRLAAKVRAPSVPGRYVLRWDLVEGEEGWFSQRHGVACLTQPVTVKPLFGMEVLEVKAPSRMFPGQMYVANVRVRNTGALAWRGGEAPAIEVLGEWTGPSPTNRLPAGRMRLPYTVSPGDVVEVALPVQAPGEPGEYWLWVDLQRGGEFRFSAEGNPMGRALVKVGYPTYGVAFQPEKPLTEMSVGQTYSVRLRLRNLGTMTWRSGTEAGSVQVGYHWSTPEGVPLPQEPLFTPLPAQVDFGGEVLVEARVQAPQEAGEYILKWDLFHQGIGWFSEQGCPTLNVPVRVRVIYGVEFLSHDTPAQMVAGQRYRITLKVRNTGVMPWEPQGEGRVTLGYRWLTAAGKEIVPQALGAFLPQRVEMGETVDLVAYVASPEVEGEAILVWDLLQDGKVWFSQKGAASLEVKVQIRR